MASIFGHVAVGLTFAYTSSRKTWPIRFWILMALSAFVPDFDVLLQQTGDCYGHRGFTHSAVFAGGWAFLATFVFLGGLGRFSRRWFLAFFSVYLATLSHPLLDALTNGGSGVAILWPMSCERFFFEARPIEVSPIGIEKFFSERGVRILLSEAQWIGIPCGIWILWTWISRRLNASRLS